MEVDDRRKAEEEGPETICAPDGRLGWRVLIPGGRPLTTPAVQGGRVFIGGGFGSHEFYAFDADSGRLAFQLGTKDDGPTAATVEEGRATTGRSQDDLAVLSARAIIFTS